MVISKTISRELILYSSPLTGQQYLQEIYEKYVDNILEKTIEKIVELSFSISRRKYPLQVEKVVGGKELGKLADIARQWRKIASEKEKLTKVKAEAEIFSDASFISSCIVDELSRLNSIYEKILWRCVDTDVTVQSIAITSSRILMNTDKEEKYLEIKFLVTNPNNIRSSLNETEVSRVKGAATKIIKCVAQEALKQNQGLLLRAMGTATSFYTKMGFDYIDTEQYGLPSKDIWMYVLGSKVNHLVNTL